MADEEEVKDTRSTYQKVEDAVNKKYEDYIAKRKELKEKGVVKQYSKPIGPTQEIPVGPKEPIPTKQYEKPIGPKMPIYEGAERAGNIQFEKSGSYISQKIKDYTAAKRKEKEELKKRATIQYDTPIGPQQPTPTKQYSKPIGPKMQTRVDEFVDAFGKERLKKTAGKAYKEVKSNFEEDTQYLWEQTKSSARNIGLSEKQSAKKYGDVQFPTLFGGEGGMFAKGRFERKVRQPELTIMAEDEYGKFSVRYPTIEENREVISKNKSLIDIFERRKHLTDYEKAELEKGADIHNKIIRKLIEKKAKTDKNINVEEEYEKHKVKIPVGHDPLSLFTKSKPTTISEEMRRLRQLKKKPKKLVYSYDVKTRDAFDLIGSPKQRRGSSSLPNIPFETRPLQSHPLISTIREPKIKDPFGGLHVKQPRVKKKAPVLSDLFGGLDVKPLKVKKAKPLKAKKKKLEDAFNFFGKPKKGGIF